MNLESGKPYSLVEIFSEQKRIVIPDLQRDYCWGTVSELAENFTKSLVGLFDGGNGHRQQCSLGLIYAYENPENLVNIADGQQRLTTVYLLLCVLYSRLPKDEESTVAKFLALDPSKAIWEPRLRYEVRESTRYFLKDFLNQAVRTSCTLSELTKTGWYRNEYATDPSVISMVKAIEAIQEVMNDVSIEKAKFSNFLLGIAPKLEEESLCSNLNSFDPLALSRRLTGYSGLCFVYFDVKDREFGEQMYVIINTRGEPMEMNEHIKPLLISKLESDYTEKKTSEQAIWAEKWEKWQDFFWQNRKEKEHSGDEGFNDFLKWYVQIKTKRKPESIYDYFSVKNAADSKIILNDFEKYFNQLKVLFGTFKSTDDKAWVDILSQIKPSLTNLRDLPAEAIDSVIIPLLAFMIEKPDDKDWQYTQLRLLRRNFFDQEWKRGEAVKWTDILKKTDWAREDDEVWKYEFEEMEKVIALENLPHFGGSLSLVPQFAAEMAWDWNDPKKQNDALCLIYSVCIEQNLFGQGNLLRRALLTVGNYFPNNSTACKDNEWHKLIFHEEEDKRAILIELLKCICENDHSSLKEFFKEKINSSIITNLWKPFIEDETIFDHCKHQRIDVGENRVLVTYNPSNFTGKSTLFVSESRMTLLRTIKDDIRPDWKLFKVVWNKDVEFEYENLSDEYALWISTAAPALGDKAMISVNSDGLNVEVGLRKGVQCEQIDKKWVERLKNIGAFSDDWDTNKNWWYAVKTIPFEGSIESIIEEVERLLGEIDIEVKRLESKTFETG